MMSNDPDPDTEACDPWADGPDDEDGDDLDTGADDSGDTGIVGADRSPREPGGTTAITDRRDAPLRMADRVWSPVPVERPHVDRELLRMPWPERAAEVIRYSVLRVERWLSPNGALREWVRLNLRVGVIALTLALLLVPPVSMLLRGTAEWSSLLKSTLLNVSDTVMGMPPIVIAMAGLLIGARFFQKRWQGRRRRGAYRERDQYDM